jgi:hypothetical protein
LTLKRTSLIFATVTPMVLRTSRFQTWNFRMMTRQCYPRNSTTTALHDTMCTL